jgi:hypothetical protein
MEDEGYGLTPRQAAYIHKNSTENWQDFGEIASQNISTTEMVIYLSFF